MEGETQLVEWQRGDESGAALLLSKFHRLLLFGRESGFDGISGGFEIALAPLLDGSFDLTLLLIVDEELSFTESTVRSSQLNQHISAGIFQPDFQSTTPRIEQAVRRGHVPNLKSAFCHQIAPG